ncbi:MAG: nucleotidyltransferase domain-containing protein [Spirochaetales bacterium]|jgi:predicted nucleotidyltransferase|nr:nucleotidyltransferase domain-containing protein [Spirochaetales bacterium]
MDRNIINGITAVKRTFPDAQFFVFGSEARSHSSRESDLDICAIFPKLTDDAFTLAAEITSEIRKYLDKALDVVVFDELKFKQRSKEPWTLEYVIQAEGILIT